MKLPLEQESGKKVTVNIKYISVLRDRTGLRQEEASFPKGSVLQDVAEWLNKRYNLSLPDSHVMLIFNGKGWRQFPLKMATEVRDGDRILLLPPLAGG